MFVKQFMAIQAKNWTTNIRAKQFLRENVSVIILSIFIIVTERIQPNQFTTPFYLGIAIAGFSRTLAVWWIQEKQTHQKELQKIMGISQLNYILSWMFYFLVNGLIVSLIMIVIMKLFVITDKTNFQPGYSFVNLALIYFLFAISNIGYVMLLCTFFSKAKTGSQAVTFIQLITNFLYFLRFAQDLVSNQILISILSLFPQMSFNMSVAKVAFTSNQFGSSFDFNYQRGVITLLLQIPVYIILSLYLDVIVPNQLGTHKHPLFFLGAGYKPKKDQGSLLLDQSQIQIQAQSSAKYQERVPRSSPPLIKLKNVSKNFGDKKVVDDMSLDFFGGQIFCLLGHNGAGKSTTINILTGLLEATSGSIQILGLSYPSDVDEIRRDIGLCLQYNVLYDDLTVQEHLRFYYRIKHQDQSRLQQQINKTIRECALQAQVGKLAKNLSGGNKRKLCLANSLIGGSRIIFLDQPSSGLDPNSRQAIWNILKTISRQNRCIILTTHHLEQAEELSKRIAIMSKGKLIIIGSTQFITDKFSVGYHAVITLNKENPNAAQTCRTIIKSRLSRCIQDKQTAKNTLKFRLPLSEVSNFSKTFRELQQAEIGLVSVYMSDLQDAFVKIGEQQDNFSEGLERLGESQLLLNKDSQIQKQSQQQDKQVKQQLNKYQFTLPEVNSKYDFSSQFKGIFVKKCKTVFRSFSTIVSVIMPTAFVSIGVLVVCIAIKNDRTDPRDRYILDQARLFILNYFMTWAFIFNTASYCGSIVLEREKKFKYLSNVSGTRQFPYWAANYALDLLLFLIPMTFFFIIVYAIGSQGEFVTRFVGYLVLILILFAFSFISYSYLFSFIFQKSSTVFRFFPFINLIFFYMLPLIPSIVDSGGILAQYVMPILTPFVALNVFFNSKEILGDQIFDPALHTNKIIVSILALCIQTLVYGFAVVKLQSMRFSLKATTDERLQQQQHQNQIRQQQQQQRDSFINAPIKIKNLTKIYGNGKIAVQNNSFSVNEGQIFGLLGPNGAGKSTSFNIITAAIPKTSGSVKLFNQQVNKGIMKIFQNIGVCPQYNPIYQNLTVREHLSYFAYIKGIQSSKIQSTIDFYKNLLSLGQYMDVKAGVLSGGNKRKMCVAMAMIGNPKIAFLDEPSAGVDPISRRYLWKCLTAATSTGKASMILTTHSMNEAETLCSKIGILIKGQFVCLDTPKNLKEQYGKGYRIDVIADIAFHLQIEKRVKELFQGVVVEKVETNPQRMIFVIKTETFSLWKAFDLFQNQLNVEKKLKRYEIKQSTLEEVFIHLSRLQPFIEQQRFAQPWQLLCWEWGNNGCQLTV